MAYWKPYKVEIANLNLAKLGFVRKLRSKLIHQIETWSVSSSTCSRSMDSTPAKRWPDPFHNSIKHLFTYVFTLQGLENDPHTQVWIFVSRYKFCNYIVLWADLEISKDWIIKCKKSDPFVYELPYNWVILKNIEILKSVSCQIRKPQILLQIFRQKG
jgi:hypothetical protein